ncbi:hypothetical protein DESC_780358 [Desulfosarcina cetonica]|nr:hypothetical protein DESC_780358 [Desulfosarcina cetonica]
MTGQVFVNHGLKLVFVLSLQMQVKHGLLGRLLVIKRGDEGDFALGIGLADDLIFAADFLDDDVQPGIRVNGHVQCSLKAHLFVNQNDLDALLGKAFFGDRPGIANAVGAAAVFATAGLAAGTFFLQAHDVYRRGVALDACHGGFAVGNQFVAADEQQHVAGAEGQGGHPVADHIQIDQLTVFGDRVGAGNEKIHQKGFPATLHACFR